MWTHCCFWSFHRICWQSDQTAPHINTAMVEAWVEYSVCWLTWLRSSPTYNLYHFPAVKAHDSYNPTHSINSITHLLHIDLVGWSLWSDTPTHTHTAWYLKSKQTPCMVAKVPALTLNYFRSFTQRNTHTCTHTFLYTLPWMCYITWPVSHADGQMQ